MTNLQTYLQSAEESQVLFNSESVKEHVVLGTDAQTVANLVHVSQNTVAIDSSISRGRGVEPWREGGLGLQSVVSSDAFVTSQTPKSRIKLCYFVTEEAFWYTNLHHFKAIHGCEHSKLLVQKLRHRAGGWNLTLVGRMTVWHRGCGMVMARKACHKFSSY